MADTHTLDPTITTVDTILAARGWTLTDFAKAKGVEFTDGVQLRTICQTCEKLGGLTRQTLHDLQRDGRIIPVRVGRRVMYEQAEIDRFVASCRRTEVAS
jgi:hypothetical protein